MQLQLNDARRGGDREEEKNLQVPAQALGGARGEGVYPRLLREHDITSRNKTSMSESLPFRLSFIGSNPWLD
jgi:hypothetical protein